MSKPAGISARCIGPWVRQRRGPGSLARGLAVLATLVLVVATAPGDGLGLSRELLQRVRSEYGGSAYERLIAWQRLADNHADDATREKLERVNQFFNDTIWFVDDPDHWGRRDYWATPVETLVTRGGDCEDFVIGKYFTLRAMGVPDDQLRLTYVNARELQQAHMVLTFYPSPQSEPLVLDNLKDRILPASRRNDLQPVYSFNGEGLWFARERGMGKVEGGGPEQVQQWSGLRRRMTQDTINEPR